MRKVLLTLCLIGSAAFSSSAATKEMIDAANARVYLGNEVTVCGAVAEISDFSRGYYLNIGNSFPHQAITFVVWSNSVNNVRKKLGDFSDLIGTELCATGKITEYKNRLQLTIKSSLEIAKNKSAE